MAGLLDTLTQKTAPAVNEFKEQKRSSRLDSILTSLIDKDNDGSMIDDVMGMAAKFIFK